MSYLITYRDRHDNIQNLEWIVPTGWSETAIERCFSEQYPNAKLITIERLAG